MREAVCLFIDCHSDSKLMKRCWMFGDVCEWWLIRHMLVERARRPRARGIK